MSSISEALWPLLGQFNIMESVVQASAANTFDLLLPANANRWAIIISAPINTSNGLPGASWIRTQQSMSSTFAGIPLGQGNGWKELTFRDFGQLVQLAWYGAVVSTAGLGRWHMTEVLIQQ